MDYYLNDVPPSNREGLVVKVFDNRDPRRGLVVADSHGHRILWDDLTLELVFPDGDRRILGVAGNPLGALGRLSPEEADVYRRGWERANRASGAKVGRDQRIVPKLQNGAQGWSEYRGETSVPESSPNPHRRLRRTP